jgi:hypothetical protein
MADNVPTSQFLNQEDTRPVWVISTLKVPPGHSPLDYVYEEDFKDIHVKVPPNGEKAVKMSMIHARRFLAQVAGFYQPNPDGSFTDKDGRIDKSKFGKPLQILEMTPEERASIDGLTQEQIDARKVELEAKMRASDQAVENAVPVGKEFPQAAPKKGGKFTKQNDKDAEKLLGSTL